MDVTTRCEPLDVVLHLADWTGPADAEDRALLALCRGATLDVGCGPGRLTHALAARGQVVLGIDVAPEAVGMTIERGASALRRDVHAALPGEGRWQTALLADGNIGIGGDPTALLLRLREVLAPGGRVVAELAAPGTPPGHGWARVRPPAGSLGGRLPWATVPVESIAEPALVAGYDVTTHRLGARWAGVLEVRA